MRRELRAAAADASAMAQVEARARDNDPAVLAVHASCPSVASRILLRTR